MLKYLFYILQSCIFMLVTSYPLQGFPTYPVIQYQEDFRNEQPTFLQPTNFNPYSQGCMTQNHVTPNYNIPISYDDYVHQIYLNNALQNQLNSALNGNYDQNNLKVQPYESDLLTPNDLNNYILVPAETISKNNTENCKKREGRCKTRVNRKKTTEIKNDDQKTNCKCKKRKNCKNTHQKAHENKEVKTIDEYQNDHLDNEPAKAKKGCRKKCCKNKSHKLTSPEETDNTVDVDNQNTNKNNLNDVKKGFKYVDTESSSPETRKILKNDKKKSKNCRKVTKNDGSCNCGRIQELDGYFNLNEDSLNLENRCTRNDDSIKIGQQHYYNMPSDFSNNMANYMMFNQQLFDTNRNFPTEFDYLYNMQQFPTFNTNGSQRKPKNRQKNRTRSQTKCKKKNCDRKKTDPKQYGDRGEIVELSPKLVDFSTAYKPPATVSTKSDESQIEKSIQDVSDNYREDLKLYDDKNEINHEDCSPNFDDYYPEFHSDNFYTSKEEYDWNNFHDRNYYSSSDINKAGRERRKYDNTDSIPIIRNDKTISYDINLRPSDIIKIKMKENKEKDPIIVEVYNQEGTDGAKPIISSEEIQFRTPPALDFPDFKTKMINIDKNTPKAEIYYQPNKNTVNKKHNNNNKMSAYSDVKNAEINEKRNKIVDQNYVETFLGHSKVVKYGVNPNNQEIRSSTANDSDCTDEEDKNPRCKKEKPFIVIAKSLPYPI